MMASSLFQILNISRQDMLSRLLELDTTSNNLANVSTIGYKSQRSNFQELLQQAQLSGGYLASTQIMTGQGSFRNTGNALDLGIEGEGYFQMRTADGQIAYSRDGQFQLDGSLNIVNGSGQRLVWQGQIPAGAEAIQVEPNGTVLTRQGTTWTQAGQIQLARFTNPSALLEKGQNLYAPSANSGPAQVGNPGTAIYGAIQAGQLEQSNVDSAKEMTDMILLQRDFQISTRVFQTTDTMIQQAIQMRRI
jgi:flagellar basal-body rod protein FlgG